VGASRLTITAEPLKALLKTTFRHASATRSEGESIWVKAERGKFTGFGEGCPRTYVAGDDIESGIQWINDYCLKKDLSFQSLADLEQWVEENENEINIYPSAWCAVEMALIDLLAREKYFSVERLFGLDKNILRSQYTAVIGDDKTWKYSSIVDQYLIRGFKDFKIKLSGNFDRDLEKLNILETLAEQHHTASLRVRLDANNLWHDRCEEAIDFTKKLGIERFFAVEEPVTAGNIDDISLYSTSINLPVILDESLCTIGNLNMFKNVPGKYIANIKVSRVGGLIRALKIISEIKKLKWPVIVGCHVGESSLLTRAGLIVSSASEESLLAHEGAYGDYLLKREPVYPTLKFGREGILNLNEAYYTKTVHGLNIIKPDNWRNGFGLQCRMSTAVEDKSPEIDFIEMPDKYKIHYRRWGAAEGEDVILHLHGGMSHSGWQAPLAVKLQSKDTNLTFVAADRRGCGLNDQRGDLGSVYSVIDDIQQHIRFLKKTFNRVHLAGWCQGAQYAVITGCRMRDMLSSLILLTPGFFWNERFRSVLSITETVIMDMITGFKLKPDRNDACIPVPMEPTDFTLDDNWLDYIEKDPLKTTSVSLKSAGIMDEIQEMSWESLLRNKLPALTIIGKNDRIVDNEKVRQVLDVIWKDKSYNHIITLESGHSVHFEKTDEVASEIINFIGKRKNL